MDDFKLEIDRLKREKNAVILAHNYQRPRIQDAADFVGDSLELSKKAYEAEADLIVFCGVYFMAETAKILNPDTRVIIPDYLAKCPMALMLKPEELKRAREQYPDAEILLYINSSARSKAYADCTCTSANAPEIARALSSDTVLFGPDRNLAYYVDQRTDKDIIPVPEEGNCPTHNQLSPEDIEKAREKHPDAEVLVHPETTPRVQRKADLIGSTSAIIRHCKESGSREFIIGTEEGMLYRLKKENPEKEFHHVKPPMICPPMKSITPGKLKESLELERYEVKVSKEVREKAKRAIDRMLNM